MKKDVGLLMAKKKRMKMRVMLSSLHHKQLSENYIDDGSGGSDIGM